MPGFMGGTAFLFMWIGFMGLMIVGIGLVFLWGIRTRQFKDQERARWLPLDGGPHRGPEERSED